MSNFRQLTGVGRVSVARTADSTGHETSRRMPRRRDYLGAVGPGVVAGAADTDPTTVATLVVVGATTVYGLAWLTLLLLPMLAVVQTLATRVGLVSGRDLQKAVTDAYGRRWGVLLLVSILTVNVVTIAADLEAGAAAIGIATGDRWTWFVAPLALLLLGLLIIGRYDEVQRVLKYVLLCLFAYGVAAVLAHPHWAAVARGCLLPQLGFSADYLAGALALLGTTLTTYMYVWQTVEQVEDRPGRRWLGVREFDAVMGTVLAVVVFWFILVASGATLGVHHLNVDTAAQAAQALRPVAGRFASLLFAVGLLASAVVALPVIMASTAYATGSAFNWRRGLSQPVRDAPGFYAVLAAGAVLGTVLALAGVRPIRLLFVASIIAGVATPIGLVMLVLVAGNSRLMRGQPAGRPLRTTAWMITGAVTVVSVVYLAQQLHLLGS
ncbi:NRAMP family divalent metal transporter [Planosporangium sp. 12N6]|uniref:NRAMP family divalent metal transporter n=1 Tax=Planosporangium spinosum TaxID=3402278 RepID=UPI003CE9C7F9